MTEIKTAVHFKRSKDDTEGVEIKLEDHQGQMIMTFSKPVDAVLVTKDDLAALNHAFGHAAMWLIMHEGTEEKPMN